MRSNTLRLTAPFGKTFWLTVVLLILMVSTAEGITRWDVFQAPLTPPRLGSRHSQLGYKLTLLDAALRKGPVDCIALGSSIIDVGFDPDYFQKGYREAAGRDIHCFNFGIDASSSISVAALARILVEDYQPRLLIYGTDARDYVIPPEDPDTAVVLDTPWVRYRQGDVTLDGWLMDHSYLYRYRQHLGLLARFDLHGTLRSQAKMVFEILPNGYTPIVTVADYINDPPDPSDDSFEVTYYTRIYSSYRMRHENLAALERILDYNNLGVQVVVVEMPVSDGLYYFFGNGEADYNRFIEGVSRLAALHQVPFWRTEPLDSIPDHGWSDYGHLNTTGAKIFSAWLGRQIGRADEDGSIEVTQP